MPRGPRDDAPGVAHHVMIRGIARQPIFRDDADRRDFARRLSRLVGELRFRCFAWALMPNHVHLVLRSEDARLSRLMARLCTGHACTFNLRHGRVGHLFQNRFRSRRAVDDVDLMGLVLYVCRNPLDAGLVADVRGLARFPWCGAAALLGGRAPHPFEAVSETLALFDASEGWARRRIRAWLGEPAPIREVLAPPPPSRETASARHDRGGSTLEAMLGSVAAGFGLTPEDLRSRSRSPRLAGARAAFARRAAAERGASGAEVARALGITRAAVSRLLRQPERTNDLTY